MQTTYSQFFKLLADFNEADVQFPPKVVSWTTIVVVETQVGRAHLAHP